MTDIAKTDTLQRGESGKPALELGLLLGQLILIALLLNQLDLLPLNVRRVIYLGMLAFPANHFLPQRYRLTFFALLSLISLVLALGVPVPPHQFWDPAALPRAGLVLAVGTILTGICLLPIGFWKRAGLLAIAAGVMAAFRTAVIPNGGFEILGVVIPMIFMFRIVSYLYDVSTTPTRPTLAQTVSYFLLSPIALFSVFIPIIDFKTFWRSHYNEAALAIYQRGIQRMARGVFQLLLYRYVAQVFSIEYNRVTNGIDLLRYLAFSPLFYLNVSGHFHFVTGFLMLFGFNLPPTNYHYLLASSFTDLWRRVNIYWKDFTLKVFYYPAYFRLKKLGATPALVISTLWIFFLSWAFHIYFVFWNSGAVHTSWKHLLFWMILGTLVMLNSLWELRKGRKRTVGPSTVSTKDSIWLMVTTAATFISIWIVLDTFGNSPSFSAWLELWRHADWRTLLGILVIVLIVMAAKFVLEIFPMRAKQSGATPQARPPLVVRREMVRNAIPLLGLYVVTLLAINQQLPSLRSPLLSSKLNLQRFYDLLEAGDSFLSGNGSEELNVYKTNSYYQEGIRQLDELFISRRIPRYSQNGIAPVTESNDYRYAVLEPSLHMAAYETSEFRTNRWGLRDRDYAVLRQPNSHRIALLGSATALGYGVKQDEVFESILEEQLNRAQAANPAATQWEVLNFAGIGYSPLSQINVLDLQAREFNPDVVMLVGELRDFDAINYRLRAMQRQGIPIPDDFIQRTLAEARVIRYINLGLAEKRLKPYEPALLGWSMSQIAEKCRRMNAKPIFVFLPPVDSPFTAHSPDAEKAANLIQLARKAGFAIIDLSAVFDRQNPEELRAGKIPHASRLAHRLIAEALLPQLPTVLESESQPLGQAEVSAEGSSGKTTSPR